MVSACGSVEGSIVVRIRYGWKKFRELLPVLYPKVFSLCTKGKLLQACIRSRVLYGNETWAVIDEVLAKLQVNYMMMLWWMCNVTLKEQKCSGVLRDCRWLVQTCLLLCKEVQGVCSRRTYIGGGVEYKRI